MSEYIGAKTGYTVQVDCATAPAEGEFPTTTTAATGSVNGAGKWAKLGGLQVHPDTEWAGPHLIRNGDFGVFTKGTTVMPDGWTMITGTYGSAGDVYFDTTTVLSGKYALKFRLDDATVVETSQFVPVETGNFYHVTGVFQSNSTTGGHTFGVAVRFYDVNQAYLSSTSSFDKVATAASTWENGRNTVAVPASARWAKIRISKAAGNFDVYLDRVQLARANDAYGQVAKVVKYAYTATASGTTTIPLDDTSPTSTEGDEYISRAYTTLAVGNKLQVRFNGVFSNTASTHFIIAMFLDSDSQASAVAVNVVDADTALTFSLDHEFTVTSGTHTIKIRAGGATAGTSRFNGRSGARLFGGFCCSTLEFTEVVA